MSLELPEPIDAYFAADRAERGDGEAAARCFTDDAVVRDEGSTYTGRAAIRKWKADSSNKYDYTSEPIGLEEQDGRIIVTSRVTGSFPGSPIDLRYFFGLDGDRIAFLEITA